MKMLRSSSQLPHFDGGLALGKLLSGPRIAICLAGAQTRWSSFLICPSVSMTAPETARRSGSIGSASPFRHRALVNVDPSHSFHFGTKKVAPTRGSHSEDLLCPKLDASAPVVFVQTSSCRQAMQTNKEKTRTFERKLDLTARTTS